VISHLPLNNSPILEGVDLLPPLEDDVEKLADEISKKHGFPERVTISRESFKSGYNKAKEKYKYTEEDMWEIGFKCEIELCEESCKHNWCKHRGCQNPIRGDSIKTTTNSQGLTQWVGEYIY
jgi:hypothetical protein